MKHASISVILFLIFLLGAIYGCEETSRESASTPVDAKPSVTTNNIEQQASQPPAIVATNTRNVEATTNFSNPISTELAAEGWIALFDGTSLFGWEPIGKAEWKVVDGAIVTDQGDKGFLASYVPFKDYELYLEFKANDETNSGVFIRSDPSPQDPATDCYEINIAAAQPQGYLTGSIVAREKASKVVKVGGWQKMIIKAVGKKIIVHVDDQETLSWTAPDDKFLAEGHILLQRNMGTVSFRNIRIKPVLEEQLFDGQTLKGWHMVTGSKGDFKVSSEQTILATGGRGFLETDAKYENFVLQFQAKTLADNLNSGLFFRLDENIEKTLSNGYEFQIHNGVKDGNPLTPVDHGTGGIFKRISARRVIAKDNSWMTCTLIAHGPKFQTWVNGYPVVAWTDTRSANKNPREGLRLEAGAISLQAHDPTTKVEFKNIGITKLK